MPTYDYKCPKCNKVVEKLHKMDFDGIVECPDCGEPMEKQFSVTKVVHLIGDGFYCNDYKGEDE